MHADALQGRCHEPRHPGAFRTVWLIMDAFVAPIYELHLSSSTQYWQAENSTEEQPHIFMLLP